MTDKLDMTSPDLVSQNITRIAALFPNCVTESANGLAIDFDQLKQELSKDIVEGNKERYRLEWPGKREAIVMANLPINKTLRPAREESVDFDNTENLYIEGDNLEVLKLLQESYLAKIKMIYIDPPYNTGKDFVYKDNFTQDSNEYQEEAGLKDEYNNRLVANPDTSGRYHSDWLSMIYPRLKLARNLLTDDGVIFISIGQNELSNLIQLSDNIFGETNRISIVGRLAKSGGNKGKFFSPNIEYIVVMSKSIDVALGFRDEMDAALIKKVYTKTEVQGEKKGEKYRAMGLFQSSLDPMRGCVNQRYYIQAPDGSLIIPPGNYFPDEKIEGSKIAPKSKKDGVWRWTFPKYIEEFKNGNVVFNESNNNVLVDSDGNFSKWNVNTKIWLKDREEDGQQPNDFISKFENRHSSKELQELEIPFDFAKPIGLIKYLSKIAQTTNNDIILDFFSGSATTAHSVMQLNAEDGGNRKYIMVQVPEKTDEKSDAFKAGFDNICEIGKERIRRAAKLISDNHNKMNKSSDMKIDFGNEIKSNVDYGFRVYKLDSSNMQDVYYTPNQYEQGQLDLLADNIKYDRTSDDLVAQIMLDWGLPLSLKIEKITIAGKEVFRVQDDALLCCFDEGIDEAFAKEIATLKPLRIVFRDKSFKDDTAKENVKQLLKQLSPDSEMKVI